MNNTNEAPHQDEATETPDTDPLLANLVRAINSVPGLEIGLTLQVSGLLVSGIVVSIAQFFRLQDLLFRDVPAGSEVLTALFAPALEGAMDEVKLHDADESHIWPEPLHVHLREATFYSADGQPGPTMPLWRSRLSEVAGWSVGNFKSIEGLEPPMAWEPPQP